MMWSPLSHTPQKALQSALYPLHSVLFSPVTKYILSLASSRSSYATLLQCLTLLPTLSFSASVTLFSFFPPSILHSYFSFFFFFHFSAFSGCCSHPRILSPVFSLSIALSSWIISSHCFTCSQYRENVLISVLSLTPICLFSEHLCPDHFVDLSNSVSLSHPDWNVIKNFNLKQINPCPLQSNHPSQT